MINNLNKDIINLDCLINSLDKLEKSSDKSNFLQQKILEKLKELEKHCPDTFSVYTESLKTKAIDLLDHLSNSVKKKEVPLQGLLEKIDAIKKRIEFIPTQQLTSTEIKKQKIDIPICLISDFDVKDENGAFHSVVRNAMQQKVPFITTRSLLCAAGCTTSDSLSKRKELRESLLQSANQWDIFQQNDPEFGSEILIFLPKNFFPKANSANEKLKAFDLVTNNSLKKISAEEALKCPERKSDARALLKLFSENPKKNKIFYLAGHGGGGAGDERVAGLTTENYQAFLKLAEQQNCKGLTISSCYSGGKSSLHYSPDLQLSETTSFDEQAQGYNYPIIVRSLGDSVVYLDQPAENDLALYMKGLSQFLESSAQTLPDFRSKLEEIEGEKHKSPLNLVKIHFSHEADAPSGMRLVGEPLFSKKGKLEKEIQEINYGVVKKSKISSSEISVQEKEFLAIAPLLVDVPITCIDSKPALVSLTPGNGHHFISQLSLASKGPEKLINETLKFYDNIGFQAKKGFFISTLHGKEKDWEQVVLYLSSKGGEVLYRENGHFYHWIPKLHKREELTLLQFAIEFEKIQKDTCPTSEAIRAMSGGQESEEMFQEAIRSSAFLREETIPSLLNLEKIDLATLSEKEKTSLLFYAIEKNKQDLAIKLLDHLPSPNPTHIRGETLVSCVVRNQNISLLKELMRRGINVNQSNDSPPNMMPLHIALALGNHDIVELLLSKIKEIKKIDPSPLIYTEDNTLFSLLLEKGVNPNAFVRNPLSPNESRTLLAHAIMRNQKEKIQALLKHGADPHLGQPSAMIACLVANDLKTFKLLIDRYKGDPFYDNSGRASVPFIEAINRCSAEFIQFLIDLPHSDYTKVRYQGMGIMAHALADGDKEKIQLLREAGAHLGSSLTQDEKVTIRKVLQHWAGNEDWQQIADLIETEEKCHEIQDIVNEALSRGQSRLLKKHMKTRADNENQEESSSSSSSSSTEED